MLRSNSCNTNHNNNSSSLMINDPRQLSSGLGRSNGVPPPPPPQPQEEDSIALRLAAEANVKASQEHDYYGAIKLYGDAIQRDNQDCRFYLNRCYCYAQLELYQLALDDAQQAINLRPNVAKCYFRKGQALMGLEKYEDAERAFREVLLRDANCVETKQELIKVRYKAFRSFGLFDANAAYAAQKYTSIKEGTEAILANRLHRNLELGLNLGTGFVSNEPDKRDSWPLNSSLHMGTYNLATGSGGYNASVMDQISEPLVNQTLSNGHNNDFSNNSCFNGIKNNTDFRSGPFGLGFNNSGNNQQPLVNNTSNKSANNHQPQQDNILTMSQPLMESINADSAITNNGFNISSFNTFNQLPDSKLIGAIVPNLVSNSYNDMNIIDGESANNIEISHIISDKPVIVQDLVKPQTLGDGTISDDSGTSTGSLSNSSIGNNNNINMSVTNVSSSITSATVSIHTNNQSNTGNSNITNNSSGGSSSNSSNIGVSSSGVVVNCAIPSAPTSYSDIVKRAKKAKDCTNPVKLNVNSCNSFVNNCQEGTELIEEREVNGCESPPNDDKSQSLQTMISQPQQAQNGSSGALNKTRPTNLWAYNGLRVANVSNSCTKPTLLSLFVKYGRVKLIEKINNKTVENNIWVYYDNPQSPVEAAAKLQGAIIEGISINCSTPLRIFFAPTDDQKDLKFSRPKQPPDNKGECYYWRTTNCFSREQCRLLHIPANKNIDAQIWMKMNKEPTLQTSQQQQQQATK